MYLSRVRLKNWRSYEEEEFLFREPDVGKPIVLIGAMNGHGKTSFLVSLYLGLFGRFGIPYCEGLTKADGKAGESYRKTLEKFRRINSKAEFPTVVELTFKPTLADPAQTPEVRVVRTWHFSKDGKSKSGKSFEELHIYKDEKPQAVVDPESKETADLIARILFPDHIMPAFFFDGEQAQSLIHSSGSQGIKQAVDILFGTLTVNELVVKLQQYIAVTRQKLGSKRASSEAQRTLDEKVGRRDKLQSELTLLEKRIDELEEKYLSLSELRRSKEDELSRLGGVAIPELSKCMADYSRAESEHRSANDALTTAIRTQLALSMAVVRLASPIRMRLESEAIREEWDGLRDSTLQRADQVLARAMPEPSEADPLLGSLPAETRAQVKARFRDALESIYNPPPPTCAKELLLGHAKGEVRQILLRRLDEACSVGASFIRTRSDAVTNAMTRLQRAKDTLDRVSGLPQEIADIRRILGEIFPQLERAHAEKSEARARREQLRQELKQLNGEISKLQDEIAKMEPEQRRLAIAEHTRQAATDLAEKLRPITVELLETSITDYFERIADSRYSGAKIRLPSGNDTTSPYITLSNGEVHQIDAMAGFERRSFGVAFSLALAKIAGVRVPLVIDTPMGNADSEYRPRLLKALTEAGLDQVIILTHDEEVTPKIFRQVRSKVNQTFLVQFDPRTRSSVVHANSYFEDASL